MSKAQTALTKANNGIVTGSVFPKLIGLTTAGQKHVASLRNEGAGALAPTARKTDPRHKMENKL